MRLNLRKRLSNAARSFHDGESNYRLKVDDFGGFKVAYRSGTADEKVIAHSFANDIFFVALPQYLPGPADVMIDVGAHIGTFSLMSARKSPRGRVFAIEASRETYDYLRINIALNGADTVSAHHLALLDRPGTTWLHHDRGNWGHSVMKRLSGRGEEVATDSLAGFMAKNAITHCDFMKFNCEGAEFPILLSTPVEVLSRVDQMLVLYHLDLAETANLESLLNHLAAAGFRCEVQRKRETRGWIIATKEANP
jgi:FkbM family methyltransferase